MHSLGSNLCRGLQLTLFHLIMGKQFFKLEMFRAWEATEQNHQVIKKPDLWFLN